MEDEFLDEEFSIMFQESERTKVLDSSTFQLPVKYLKVRKPVILPVTSNVNDAVDIMQKKEVSCVLVTRESKLAGILTERDIVRKAVGKEKDLRKIRVEDIMTRDPQSFQLEDSIAFVINAMDVGGYRHVPIVDEANAPLGIVSVRDIIGFIAEYFPEDVRNLPPRPMRHVDQQDGG